MYIAHARELAASKKNIKGSRSWYSGGGYRSGIIGSSFTNANGDTFGNSFFNDYGAVLLWKCKNPQWKNVYHVGMFWNALEKHNGGHGFHITDERQPKIHYYFDRYGKWLDTTPKTAAKSLPIKVQTIAKAFVPLQALYRL